MNAKLRETVTFILNVSSLLYTKSLLENVNYRVMSTSVTATSDVQVSLLTKYVKLSDCKENSPWLIRQIKRNSFRASQRNASSVVEPHHAGAGARGATNNYFLIHQRSPTVVRRPRPGDWLKPGESPENPRRTCFPRRKLKCKLKRSADGYYAGSARSSAACSRSTNLRPR